MDFLGILLLMIVVVLLYGFLALAISGICRETCEECKTPLHLECVVSFGAAENIYYYICPKCGKMYKYSTLDHKFQQITSI